MERTLIDEMRSLIESLDVEEIEVYYEDSKNILDDEESSKVHIIYYPESSDIIEVANLVQNELCCGNYKRSAISIDSFANSGKIKAIPFIKKDVITFEKEKRMFKDEDFKVAFKNSLLKVAEMKRETLRFELKGTNEDTSNWDESDVEMLEYDITI